jgi:hypothetical protein
MEPSWEQVEVPVVKPSEIKKQLEENKPDPNEVADLEKDTEHQFVFSDKKVDGTKVSQEQESTSISDTKHGAPGVAKS